MSAISRPLQPGQTRRQCDIPATSAQLPSMRTRTSWVVAIATPAFARSFNPEVAALRVETRAAQSASLPPIVAISRPRARASRDMTVPIGTSVASAISR
jgi:hypothetical protein